MEAIFVVRRSKIVSVFLSLLLLSIALTLAAPPVHAAMSLSTTTPITQNFDGLGTSGTAPLPSDWRVSKDGTNVRTVGTYSTASTATAYLGGNSLSSSASNGIYNFGAGVPSSATDRAVGFLSSSTATKSGNLYAYFNNGTGDALSAVLISYTVEKYRNGSNPAGYGIQLYYSFNGSSWTSAGTNFLTSFFADADSNGFTSAPGATVSVSNRLLPVNIPNGSDFYLAWNYSVSLGTSTSYAQALAIDDFSILGIAPTGSTPPSGVGTASPSAVIQGDSPLLTVAVTSGANPTSTGLSVTCDLSTIGGPASQAFYDDATNGDSTAGDNIFSFATTITGAVSAGAKNIPCTVAETGPRSSGARIGITVYVVLPIGTVNGPVADTDDGTLHRSSYAPASGTGAGSPVTVRGVIYEKTQQAISGSTSVYYGFFMQNTASTRDSDLNTSDGLYVYVGTTPTMSATGGGTYTPTVGDEVIVSGAVSEYYYMTELTSPFLSLPVIRSGANLDSELPPFVANPPTSSAYANRYWERQQGMRAQVPQNSIVLNGRNVFNPADAEVWLARSDSTIAMRGSAYERRAFRDAHPLDDNYDADNWDGNGYRILMGSWGIKATAGDGQALINPARTFSTVTNSPVGGINYSYSKYRIEVTEQPTFSQGVDPAANNPPQTFDRTRAYSIVDYNLENLYDFRDNPASACDFATDTTGCPKVDPFLAAVTPPYDYVPTSDADYQARLADIAHEIIDDLHSPDILMLQEVENQDICSVSTGALNCGTTDGADGKPDVLQELALKIASLDGPAYDAAFDRNSSDLRGILPAFMYRTDRVELLSAAGDPLLGANPTIANPSGGNYTGVPANADISNPKTLNAVLPAGITQCETKWVFPRAPDIGLFRIYQTSIGVGTHRDVYVINNHFKSGPDTCVDHRTEQAKYNAALVDFIKSTNPNARIVLGGDLNVYPRPDDPFAPIGLSGSSDQLGELYNSGHGLKNLWEVLRDQAPAAAYSYVYLGMAQTLDQMFVSQAMLTDLKEFRIAHINSDFAADYTGDVARGTSDHDPNAATFVINDPPTAEAHGPYSVNEGASVQLNGTGTDPENGTLTYAWDLNNDGTFETSGANPTVSATDIAGPTTRTVTLQVTDDGGLTTTDSATINIDNVAPSITSVTNNGPIVAGASATISVSASDPGGAGDTLHYEFDCNNDTTYEIGPQTGNSASCSFGSVGTFTVNVRVTDSAPLSVTGSTFVVVNNPVPTLTSISPASAQAGGPAFTLTVSGTNFINGSTMRWNSTSLTTSFVSSTQLTATVPASNILNVGTANVTVFNPTPGGGTSSPQTFAIGLTNTSLQLTASSSSIRVGQPVTLTATLTQVYSAQARARAPQNVTPSGTITFTLDSTTNITRPVDANGVTTYVTNTLTVGTHTATAKYSGDTNLVSATSAPVSVLVNSIKTFFPFLGRGSVSPQSSP